MGKILNFYKKMSVEDAICVFCLLGFALMTFAIAGIVSLDIKYKWFCWMKMTTVWHWYSSRKKL